LYIVWLIEVPEHSVIGLKSILIVCYGTQTKDNIEKTYQKAIQISHPLITMIITLFFYRLTPMLTHPKKQMTRRLRRRMRRKMRKKMRRRTIKKMIRKMSLRTLSFQSHKSHQKRKREVKEILKWSTSNSLMAIKAQAL